jgi:hypothetical protein
MVRAIIMAIGSNAIVIKKKKKIEFKCYLILKDVEFPIIILKDKN